MPEMPKDNEDSTQHGRDHFRRSDAKIVVHRERPTPLRRSLRLNPNGDLPNTPVGGGTRANRSKSSPKMPFSVVRRRIVSDGKVGERGVVACGSVFAANGRRRSARFSDSGWEGRDVVGGSSSVVRGSVLEANERRRTAGFCDSVGGEKDVVGYTSVVYGSMFAANGRRKSSRFLDSVGEQGFQVSKRCVDGGGIEKCVTEGGGRRYTTAMFRDSVTKRGFVGSQSLGDRWNEKGDGDSTKKTSKGIAERKMRKLDGIADAVDADRIVENERKVVGSVTLMQPKSKNRIEIESEPRKLDFEENMLPCSENLSAKSDVVRSMLEEAEEMRNESTNMISSVEKGFSEKGNEKGNVDVQKSEEGCVSVRWTSGQDKALHKAYLLARPSPHFWKKISKMVAGKSAKECFDRVHSNYVTPPIPLPRSRLNRKNMSPLNHFNFLGGNPDELFKENVRKTRGNKQKHLAQRTARHILRKHCLVDQEQETDMFSVFETSVKRHVTDGPHLQVTSSSNCIMNSASLRRSNKSAAVRCMALEEKKKPSPAVLKKIKNMKIHEKYIDQLHQRNAEPKASVTSINHANREPGKENIIPKTIVVKAAKSALLSEAREVISKFQHEQAYFPIKSVGYEDCEEIEKGDCVDSPI